MDINKMNKTQKVTLVEDLGKDLSSATCIVLINYAGLTVKSQQELKGRLKEVGASMLVVKNTLLKRAADNAKLDKSMLSDEILMGQTALVLGSADPVLPIQVLGKFAKEFEIPSLKVGIVEGSFQDTEGLKKISNLPSKEVIIGQVLGKLMSPSYSLVSILNSNLQKLVYILQTASQK